MKLNKLRLPLAIAAAMGVAVTAYADGEYNEGMDGATIKKNIELDQQVEHKGYIQTLGLVLVNSTATSISDVEQKTIENSVVNGRESENDAIATDDALSGASGNIGLNVAAGDNNIQQNSTAISSIESPSTSSVNVEAGYSINEHYASEDNFNMDKAHESSSSYSDSHSGSKNYSSSDAASLDITNGTYDFSQADTSTTETVIDAEVNGTIDYDTASGSLSGSGMVTPTGELGGGVASGQVEGWYNSKEADLVVQEDSNFDETDTTSTSTSTDISAEFTASASSSEDKSFDAEWSESSEQAESGSFSMHKDSHDESSYDYNEFASLDAELVFGAALDAETFSKQAAYGNQTYNYSDNSATLNGNVAQGAAGNIGVNITAGNSNAQANQLAIAAGSNAVMATATAASSQSSAGNYTENGGDVWRYEESGEMALSEISLDEGSLDGYTYVGYFAHSNNATIGDSALQGATGNIGVNVSAGTNNLQGNALAISSINGATGGNGGAVEQ